MKKKVIIIIIIGWILLGVLAVGLFGITVMAVLQGEGAMPWKVVRGGRGGSVFPVALLPVFLLLIVIGGFWIKHRFFSSNRDQKRRMNESK